MHTRYIVYYGTGTHMDNTLIPKQQRTRSRSSFSHHSASLQFETSPLCVLSTPPPPPDSPCACMQCEWRTLRGVGPEPRGGDSCSGCPSPLAGEKNHHLRKSRRAKCALHWHSPEQKMPIFVSTCRSYSAPRFSGGRCAGLMRAPERAPPRLVPGWAAECAPGRPEVACGWPVPARQRERWGRTV